MKTCPICKKEMDDVRHVGIECFYAVNEYAPSVSERKFYLPVNMDDPLWGITRTYHGGTVDRFVTTSEEPRTIILEDDTKIEVPVSKIEREQVSLPKDEQDQRFLELSVYQMTCCKSCRAAFLEIFAAWTRGHFVDLREKIEDLTKNIDEIAPNIVEDETVKDMKKYLGFWKVKDFISGILKKWY